MAKHYSLIVLGTTCKAMEYGVNQHLFFYATTSKILKTPQFEYVRHEAPTWRFEKDGEYTVGSTYLQIMNTNNDFMQHLVVGNWNLIWNLKIPPKVKNFLWCTYYN
jgi:hypothetical protein